MHAEQTGRGVNGEQQWLGGHGRQQLLLARRAPGSGSRLYFYSHQRRDTRSRCQKIPAERMTDYG